MSRERRDGATGGPGTDDPALIGRAAEVAAIDRLLDRPPGGGRVLALRGDAGLGKSALLDAAARLARAKGFVVLRCSGVECEAHIAYAGLHQLVRPVLDRTASGAALVDAFAGRREVSVFGCALDVLDLVGDVASDAPLLLAVDDAHWIDRTTAEVLAFVGRRLGTEPVVMIVAGRDDDGPIGRIGCPVVELAPLPPDAAAAVLDVHGPTLDPDRRARILELAAGNPLALAELPVTLGTAPDLGAAPVPSTLPLSQRLERSFSGRLDALPAATRQLLVTAAVDDVGLVGEVLAAAAISAGAERTLADLVPAEQAGLVELDDRWLRFRHPLVRSAVHQAATASERALAHGALARAIVDDPERSLWHHVASTVAPDDALADEAEAAALAAAGRGAVDAAMRGIERAAVITSSPSTRARRLVDAAELAVELGRHDVAERLIGAAGDDELTPLDAARRAWVAELVAGGGTVSVVRVEPFVDIVDRLGASGDPELAVRGLTDLTAALWWSGPDRAVRELVARAVERLPLPSDHPMVLSVLASAAPIERGAVVLRRLAGIDVDGIDDARALETLAEAAMFAGDPVAAHRLLARAAERFRADGRLAMLARSRLGAAWTAIHLGDVRTATVAADEAARLAADVGLPLWLVSSQLARASAAGLRGDEERSADLLRGVGDTTGAGPLAALVAVAAGCAAAGSGRFGEAFDALDGLFDPGSPTYQANLRPMVLADLAEAGVHGGRAEAVRRRVAELAPLVPVTASPILSASVSFADALLADDREAEAAYQRALDVDLGSWPSMRGRVLLGYGRWLRRHRRVAESRVPLRAASDLLASIGDVPRADQAGRELMATGEHARRRRPEAWDQLTPQELQIAELAADGMSNREIGQRLFISHRTVGTHLYRLFPKLGVRARGDLASALGRGGAAPA